MARPARPEQANQRDHRANLADSVIRQTRIEFSVHTGPLPRGAPRVRGHIGAHRRQVDPASGRRARAWTDALQTDLQAGRGYLATHADADAEGPGARWPRHANGLPDQSATGGL